jgi:hypothetical protein
MVHATKKEAIEAGKTCITISDSVLRRDPILANRTWLLEIIHTTSVTSQQIAMQSGSC